MGPRSYAHASARAAAGGETSECGGRNGFSLEPVWRSLLHAPPTPPVLLPTRTRSRLRPAHWSTQKPCGGAVRQPMSISAARWMCRVFHKAARFLRTTETLRRRRQRFSTWCGRDTGREPTTGCRCPPTTPGIFSSGSGRRQLGPAPRNLDATARAITQRENPGS